MLHAKIAQNPTCQYNKGLQHHIFVDSHPPEETWKMESSSRLLLALRTMNGKNISDEKRVFRKRTGITAFSFSASFLNES